MKWLTRTLAEGKKAKKGFTLIELMIVVIVVAVLAAAAIPLYRRSVQRARASEGMALLGSIRTHYLVEVAEHPGAVPAAPGTSDDAGLLTWGIEVSTNRWWKDFGGGTCTITWSLPNVTVNGVAATDLEGIQLSINCGDGVITETYT